MRNSSECPRVAVLMACYNGAPWIDEQITSILHQIGVSLDLFISLDISVDGTNRILSEWSNNCKNVFFTERQNIESSAAQNFFSLICNNDFEQYDYIAFSDQDDVWFPNKLQRAVESLNENKIHCYSSDVLAFWPNGKFEYICKSQDKTQYDYLFEAAGPGCTYVLSNAALQRLRFFLISNVDAIKDISYHDWLIYAFCRSEGLDWLIDSMPSLLYRQHSNNVVGARVGIGSYLRRLYFVSNKKFYRQHLQIMSLIFDKENQGKFKNKLFLILNFYKFRRRSMDKLLLLFALLFFWG